ncbi:MAG: branched-chain amino acid ABC transporter permease [Actinobacteria bacterium]|nr:branched-chain amino acid ABC transporter permease [Actinomycetota bacterium]
MELNLALGFGLVTASILALGAVGFTLQFGITNIFNLSFGQVMTVGMFAAYLINVQGGQSLWVGVLGGALAGAVVSGFLNKTVFMPFLRRGVSLDGIIIVSLAVGLVLENVMLAFAGPSFKAYNQPRTHSIHVLGMILTVQQLLIIGISVAALVGLHLLLRQTRLGKAMRATAANAGLARTSGIATDRVTMIAWCLSGALCGAAGVTFALNLATFDTTTGSSLLLVVIAAAVFGGVGQPYGAMLGALVIGLATEFAALVSPNLKEVIAFAILVVMLLVRPDGLIPSAATKETMGAR